MYAGSKSAASRFGTNGKFPRKAFIMSTIKISLDSIDKVKSFVNILAKFDCDFDLISGRYIIDAKSIMGIFSLDLSKPIDLEIHADGKDLDLVTRALSPYRIDEN